MQEKQPDAREDVYFVLTSLAHVAATVLFGELLNLSQVPGLLLIGFALTSKTFALFAGENERFFKHLRWASVPLAIASLVFLAFLPVQDMVLGVAIMLLYLNYPRLLKARERSPLDVLFHGTRYAILFWIGYGGAVTGTSIAAASIVFCFGVAGELLVGLRNNGKWKTTASIIGIASTVRIVNVLTFVLILLGSYLFSTVVNFPLLIGGVSIPVPLLIGIVVALFITRPVSRHKSWIAPVSVRRREILVIAIVTLLFVGIPLTTRVDLASGASQSNYTVIVGMQLIVTGPHTFDGQWIIFNYRNPENYYYVLLHTNGTLELARDANGSVDAHLMDVQTGLSPFQWHEYNITVVGGIAQISVDGHLYITMQIQDPGGQVMVDQFFPKPNYWVVSVTEFRVTTAS